MNEELFICKVQRPLSPIDGPWLIYNEDRSFVWQGPAPQEIKDFYEENNLVIAYFFCKIVNGALELDEIADFQDW